MTSLPLKQQFRGIPREEQNPKDGVQAAPNNGVSRAKHEHRKTGNIGAHGGGQGGGQHG